MGFFDFLKTTNNSNNSSNLERVLSELELNPYDYNHSDMEASEVTIDDELRNVVKVSDFTFDDDKRQFEYISLSDKADGKKAIFASKNNADERDLRDLINLMYSHLGEDFVYQKEFNQDDLFKFRSEPNGIFRTWYLKYEIEIGFLSQTIYVNVDEK